ncbi:unnamed protein product [Sphagnum compactum]
MITTSTDPGDDPEKQLPLSAQGVLNFYKDNAANIFPPAKIPIMETIRQFFCGAKYNPQTLDKLLVEYCGERTLSGALTNVIIPSFDIKLQQPVFFSSWKTSFKDVLVRDVCRATTAAPTFLPPVEFDAPTGAENNRRTFNMIDGGIAANNPSVLWYLTQLDMSLLFPQNDFEKLLVLSLGTGRHRTGYSAEDAKKWGVIKWLRHNGDTPLISSLQNASADMVDYNLSMIFDAHGFRKNYLRIQTNISPELSKLDDSKNLEKLMCIGVKLLTEQNVFKFTSKTWEIVTTRTPEKIKDELDRFAMRLSNLRKMRPPIIL